jgi:hypothetical protein
VPSLIHDGPLDSLRKQPAQVPALIREALGLALPRFGRVTLTDSDYTQVRPTSFHADLTVTLHGAGREPKPVMGIIVEIQLRRDSRKRRSWPLYAAALHARLRCQTCLVVIAPDAGVARWAAAPIATLQPNAPFIPLVIGPEQIPRLLLARARRQPWMAVLSALAHGNSPGGVPIARAAIEAIRGLPDERAKVCFDLIRASLNETVWRALENEMQHGKYVYKSDFARHYVSEGREEGRREGREEGHQKGREEGHRKGREEGHQKGRKEGQLQMARTLLLRLAKDRFGLSGDSFRRAVEACDDLARLTSLHHQLVVARDRQTAERLVAALETKRARSRHGDPARPRSARAPGRRSLHRGA